jgi:ribose transport system permease protein
VSATDAPARSQSADAAEPERRRGAVLNVLERFGVLVVLAVLILLFSLLKPDTFPTYGNFTTIVTTQDILVILAIGAMVPLAAGQFDLSIGSMLGFAGMEVGVLTANHGWGIAPAIAVTLACCAAVGAINGFLVARVGLNAFIATLAMGSVLLALTQWMSNGAVISDGIPNGLLDLAQTQVARLPLTAFYMLGLIALFWYVMNQTPFGRYLYALGGGPEAARLAGLPTRGLTAAAFVISALAAGVAGVLETATVGAAHPDVGADYLLPAFAAAFLGATTIQPGRFNVLGTVFALFLLAVGIAGLQQLGAPFWVAPAFDGVALLVAVSLAVKRSRSLA